VFIRVHRRPCLLLLLAAFTLHADTYPRQPGIDVQHYTFRLTLTDETDDISGETTADVRFVRDGVTELTLDLASTMHVTFVSSQYTHAADRLAIIVDPPSHAGERRQFTIAYHGIPTAGLRIGANKYGERTFFSQNWPDQARQWLPVIDHPYDKATSEFIVTAPGRYQVVANGLLQEQTDLSGGRRRTHWKQSAPIASWLNALGVAQFATRHFTSVRGIPLQTWVYPEDRDAGTTMFETSARQALEFYSEHIGPYPYEKLANVEATGFTGGMELASAIFYGEKSVAARPAPSLVAHEIAHQWFGDAVTEKDWDDVWLSEGFATYFTLLFLENSQGRDAFVEGLKHSREAVLASEKKNPGLTVIHNNLADMRRVLNPLVYQTGGWTLHMLRAQMGTDMFWAGIRDYYRRYRDSNASTDDFRKTMEENSGADLSWFFRQWLQRAGSPVLEGSWRYNAGVKRIEIDLTQTQAGEFYRLPLEIGIATEGERRLRIEKIDMTRKDGRFEFDAEKEPSSVVLDPNTWLLMELRFAKRAN